MNRHKVVDAYKNLNDRGVFIGEFHGFDIFADIVHGSAKSKQDIKHVNYYNQDEAKLIRDANVVKLPIGYRFNSFQDLMVTFTLKSSLPNFLDSLEVDFDAHSEQFRLINVGSIFSSQLCSTVVESWLKYRAKIESEK